MQPTQWYELRVRGSIGTHEGAARGATEGVAIGEDGYVCAVASGHAMHFESQQAAIDYLARSRIPGKSQFEIVPCHCRAVAA